MQEILTEILIPVLIKIHIPIVTEILILVLIEIHIPTVMEILILALTTVRTMIIHMDFSCYLLLITVFN